MAPRRRSKTTASGRCRMSMATCGSPPIVVGGCYRSGTSVVRRVLNAHSRIYCGPEIKFWSDYSGDYRSDPLRAVRFFATARTVASESELLELFGGAFVRLHEYAARRSGKRRWADKAPENAIYLAQWQRMLGDDWVFVHVVRNPLDVLSSMHEARFDLTLPSSLRGRIELYHAYMQAPLLFRAKYPKRYVQVVYEELAEHPDGTIAGLMQSLNELPEATQSHFGTVSHDLGLEDPKVAATSGVLPNRVGRWKSCLSVREKQVILGSLGPIWREATALDLSQPYFA